MKSTLLVIGFCLVSGLNCSSSPCRQENMSADVVSKHRLEELFQKLTKRELTDETALLIKQYCLDKIQNVSLDSLFLSTYYELSGFRKGAFYPLSTEFRNTDLVTRDIGRLLLADVVAYVQPSRISLTNETIHRFAISFQSVEQMKGKVEADIVVKVHSPAFFLGTDGKGAHDMKTRFLFLEKKGIGWAMIPKGEYLNRLLYWYKMLKPK